ncbi:hypothetical protein PLESTB_000080800 [Pleodorina starrii]|uniref:Uncharacterized protein n=1 Tax=Pleodorina starrii TaxID=330485 RepID=A0A9W6EX40_9CHLO|nr:hypothetical protein PLESTB_000080800 [Pleodorina starrii]GLC66582.1 hypothetical protein PLESTF_000446600 [Pleodorina starrii]
MLPARHCSWSACQEHRRFELRTLGKCRVKSTLLHRTCQPKLPSSPCPGDTSTSGRCSAPERLVACAAGDGQGSVSGGQFAQFRDFQRQASAAARQELSAGERRGKGSRSRPYRKSYWGELPQGWFAKPEYTAASLYEDIIRKCEANTCGQDALFMICKLANNPQEARIVLNAFAAVRASLVRQGYYKPYGERLAVAFVHMIRTADAPDVLVEALRRAAELGLLLSRTRLHELLKQWGQQGELAKIEEVLASMPLGGVPYDHVTAYIVIRTAVNLGAMDKAEYYAAAMQQRQIRLTGSTQKLLELGRERQAGQQQQQQQQRLTGQQQQQQ